MQFRLISLYSSMLVAACCAVCGVSCRGPYLADMPSAVDEEGNGTVVSGFAINRVYGDLVCNDEAHEEDDSVYGEEIRYNGKVVVRTLVVEGELMYRWVVMDSKSGDFVWQRFDKGQLKSEEQYISTEPHGLSLWYDSQGKVSHKGIFRHGLPWEGTFPEDQRDGQGHFVCRTNTYYAGQLVADHADTEGGLRVLWSAPEIGVSDGATTNRSAAAPSTPTTPK